MSVRVPYAMPDRRNPLAFNPGQGCATLLAGLRRARRAGRAAHPDRDRRRDRCSSTPPLPVATLVTLVLANAYGALDLVGGPATIASRDVWWRLPELLDAVSPRQAG